MRQLVHTALLWALSTLLSVAMAAEAIHEFHLDNGLKVIVRPDHRAPVVVSQLWYKVGSSYEPRGLTGISHVLEHMMFKGTPRFPDGEFSRLVALNGGRENAFTSRDYTGYYQMLAKDRLPLAFELEADRMRNVQFDEEKFRKELQVVMEERRLRTEDNPISLAWERFGTVTFPLSPYRQPVVGWMADLQSMTLDDLRVWYDRYYAPNNAILVVAGDVEPEAVRALAQKHFGPIPARTVPDPRPAIELDSPGERRMVLRLPAQLPYLAITYPTPTLATSQDPAEVYALAVLSGVLDGGDSARLESGLVRGKELAAGISAGYDPGARLDSQFTVAGYPRQGTTLEQLEAAALAELERLRSELVGPEELERVKNQIIADHLYSLDSIFAQAMEIGQLETAGIGWEVLTEYERNIRAVTAEELQAVARKYLTQERQAVLHLIPIGGQG